MENINTVLGMVITIMILSIISAICLTLLGTNEDISDNENAVMILTVIHFICVSVNVVLSIVLVMAICSW